MSFYEVQNPPNYAVYRSNKTQSAVQDNLPLTSLVPVGTVLQFAASTTPAGYLLCNGSAVSRISYKFLFDVIGTTYGVGDGSTTFNLPNVLGRVIVGYDLGQTQFDALGETGGANTHTLTIPEMPSHNHTITDPGHNHSYVNQPNTANPAVSLTTTDVADNVNVTQTTGTSTTGITINNTGGGLAHNNLQPYIVMNYIIKF